MRKTLSLIIFVLVASTLKGQIYSGRVTDKEGRAIPLYSDVKWTLCQQSQVLFIYADTMDTWLC
jgi:hypothetical protein